MTGADALPFATGAVVLAAVVYGLARRMRVAGPEADRSFVRPSAAAYASDGWRRDTFVMNGLEEDGDALREATDEAGMFGYRREPGDDRYSWRFIREPRA